LYPWANTIASPLFRFGSIDSLYTCGWISSGSRMNTMVAFFTASGMRWVWKPSSFA